MYPRRRARLVLQQEVKSLEDFCFAFLLQAICYLVMGWVFFKDPQHSGIQQSRPWCAKIKTCRSSLVFFLYPSSCQICYTTKVVIFINLSAFICPYTVLKKAHSHQNGSRVDTMLEYGYEIVFACKKFMFITMIFLLLAKQQCSDVLVGIKCWAFICILYTEQVWYHCLMLVNYKSSKWRIS